MMKKEKRLCLQGGVIALAVFVALFLIAANSFAIALTGVHVNYSGGPYGPNNWATEYEFLSDQTGPDYLDAFCVEGQNYYNGASYELISVPVSFNTGAKNLALEWFYGEHLTSSVKEHYQIAIWHVLDIITYTAGAQAINELIHNAPLFENFGPISLATSLDSQDYLLRAPVPEPATMLLLGIGLIGLAGVGRRKFFKR